MDGRSLCGRRWWWRRPSAGWLAGCLAGLAHRQRVWRAAPAGAGDLQMGEGREVVARAASGGGRHAINGCQTWTRLPGGLRRLQWWPEAPVTFFFPVPGFLLAPQVQLAHRRPPSQPRPDLGKASSLRAESPGAAQPSPAQPSAVQLSGPAPHRTELLAPARALHWPRPSPLNWIEAHGTPPGLAGGARGGLVVWTPLCSGLQQREMVAPLSASRCSSSQRGRTLAVTFLVTFLGGSRVPR